MIELIVLWFIVSVVVGVVIGHSIHAMNVGDAPEDQHVAAAKEGYGFFPPGSLDSVQAR